MANSKTTVVWQTERLLENIIALDPKIKDALVMYAETQAKEIRAYMQQNKRWTDRTGDAKRFLNALVRRTENEISIELTHGVDYGWWLEMAHERNFAIIEPTVRLYSPRVIRGVNRLMNKMR